MRLAQQMAIEQPLVRAEAIEATEFPQLSRLHRVMGVPKTVIGNRGSFEGALPESQFVAQVLRAVS